MAQLLKGYLADASEKFLLELLDTAGKFSHLDAIEKIDKSDEMILNEDIQIETEENAFHEKQIKNMYVSVIFICSSSFLGCMACHFNYKYLSLILSYTGEGSYETSLSNVIKAPSKYIQGSNGYYRTQIYH